MNDMIRKQIKDLQARLNAMKTELEDIKNDIESIKDEEQEKFDNMPEGFQQGPKGEAIEAACVSLEEAYEACETVESDIDDAIGNLDNAL